MYEQKINQVIELAQSLLKDAQNADSGVKAAAARTKRGLRDITKLSREARQELLKLER